MKKYSAFIPMLFMVCNGAYAEISPMKNLGTTAAPISTADANGDEDPSSLIVKVKGSGFTPAAPRFVPSTPRFVPAAPAAAPIRSSPAPAPMTPATPAPRAPAPAAPAPAPRTPAPAAPQAPRGGGGFGGGQPATPKSTTPQAAQGAIGAKTGAAASPFTPTRKFSLNPNKPVGPAITKTSQSGIQYTHQQLAGGGVKKTITHPDGTQSHVITKAGGSSSVETRDASGKLQSSTSVKVNPITGKRSVTTVNRDPKTGDMTKIHPNGAKTVTSADGMTTTHTRANGDTITKVRTQTAGGFTQSQTTVRNGVSVTNTYNYHTVTNGYGQPMYHTYMPVYNPYFYGNPYYYHPFYSPMYYSPGLFGCVYCYGGGYYGSWFSPYPYYSSPAFWLTDFLIMDMLSTSYQNNVQVNAGVVQQQSASVQELQSQEKQLAETQQEVTDLEKQNALLQQQNAQTQQQVANIQGKLDQATKDQMSTQVQGVLEANKAQKPVQLDDTVANLKHVYSVHQEMNVSDSDGGECALTEGDLVRLNQVPDPNADPNVKPVPMISSYNPDAMTVDMVVVTSKGDDACEVNKVVQVSKSDAQDMLNEFSKRVESGLGEYDKQKKAGKISQ